MTAASSPPPLPGRKVQVPLVVELTGEQEQQWAALRHLETGANGVPMAKTTVEDVRAFALAAVKGTALGELATIAIK